jgi:hypothetical protein
VIADRPLPDDALEFIRRCVRERKVYWTYHVNMRLTGRHISRDDVFGAGDSYDVIESYPDDKYLPSYLVVEADHVRVVTAYRPNPTDWEPDLRTRSSKT